MSEKKLDDKSDFIRVDLKDESTAVHEDYKHKLYEKLGHSDVLTDDTSIPDIEYLFQKTDELPLLKARDILKQCLQDHDDDPNFPNDDFEFIQKIVNGYNNDLKMSYDDWVFNVKMYAALNEYHSPYPEVRAISSPRDDPNIPCETIRAYILGFFWCVVGTGVNELFSRRQPSIYLSASVCQMLMYPSGLALEYVLPDWGLTLFGTRHSLNPGPWTYKEQMFATVMFDIAIGGMYVGYNFYVEKLNIFYGNTWITAGYQILLSLCTQLFGFGFAGILRKIVTTQFVLFGQLFYLHSLLIELY